MIPSPPAQLRSLALCAALLSGPEAHAGLSRDRLGDVGVRPPPGASLPLDSGLTSLDGRMTTLREAIRGRPAVAIFADYDCPQLCSPILALAADGLAKSGLTPGVDFSLVVIGFNPRASAADGKRMVGGQVGLDTAVGRATTALTASEPVAARLEAAVGYHAVYDEALGRYAHPAALLVVTADGRLSRVLSGLAISGDNVRLALVEAGRGGVGDLGDRLRLLCYGFDPSVGFYDRPVRLWLGAAGAATVVALGAGLATLSRRRA